MLQSASPMAADVLAWPGVAMLHFVAGVCTPPSTWRARALAAKSLLGCDLNHDHNLGDDGGGPLDLPVRAPLRRASTLTPGAPRAAAWYCCSSAASCRTWQRVTLPPVTWDRQHPAVGSANRKEDGRF